MATRPRLRKEPLQFEVITPLYLGGANPRSAGDAHIYIRPIVAQWRWWFRALAAGVFGTTPTALNQVRTMEQLYFGGVHSAGGAETGSLAFRVRLASEQLKDPVEYTANRDPVFNYLGYGLGGTRDQKARVGIPPGSRFILEVICSDEVWKLLPILNYFWVNFGGLGARHRRGLGSLEWIHPTSNPVPQDGHLARNLRGQFMELPQVKQHTQSLFGNELPEAPVIHPGFFRVKLSRTFEDWKHALAAIRNQLRLDVGMTSPPPQFHLGTGGFGYRQGDGRNHKWVPDQKRFPDGRSFPYYASRDKPTGFELQMALASGRKPARSASLLNPLFGLPMIFVGWNLSITAFRGQDEIRRPSPLSFRVFRNGKLFQVAVVYFKSRFLPDGAQLRAVYSHGRKQDCLVDLGAGWEYLDRFFELCDGKEVVL